MFKCFNRAGPNPELSLPLHELWLLLALMLPDAIKTVHQVCVCVRV